MNKIFVIQFWLIFAISTIYSQNYNWPCQPFAQQHFINGTFCENRPDGNILIDHFHDGVDIDLAQGNNVYSVINGTVSSVGAVSQYGINSFVRVGRYAYVHVIPNPSLTVGSPVTAFQTIVGTTNSWNHIHFKDGFPGSEINALRSGGGLDPFVDPYLPNIVSIKYYINATTTQFLNNRVSGLVDIVARAFDNTDLGTFGSNNGIYSIGYQIFDSTGTNALTQEIKNFIFNSKPSNSNITNVYFYGSNLSTYIYNITNRITSDGSWDTRNYSPGTYKIRIFAEDTRMNILEEWSTVEVIPQDVTPPAIPELTSILKTGPNEWTLSWLPNDSSDIDGYRLYFSLDGENWSYQQDISNQISRNDTSLTFNNYPNDTQIYFRLSAYDNAAVPNHSDSSDAYGIILSDIKPKVLIVDGFDRTDGYWQNESHMFAVLYGQAISQLPLALNTCSNEAIIEGKVQLQDFDVVMYLLGDESGQTHALDQNEQFAIQNYLQGGGKLVISGSDIGYDLVVNGNTADSTFFTDYLKSSFVADSATVLQVVGRSGTWFDGFIGDLHVPFNKIIKPDIINPVNSTRMLDYSDGSIASIYNSGIFPGGSVDAQLFYFAFPIDLISTDSNRDRLISLIMEQTGLIFIVPGFQDDLGNNNPNSIELFDNYPNPFNPTTTIKFYLPEKRYVKLKIYSTNGQKLRALVSARLNSGLHSYIWDISDNNLASGIYYYQIVTNNFKKTKKMILLK